MLNAAIQAALEALPRFGAGNVTVTLDVAGSTGRVQKHTVNFPGDSAAQNIADFVSHFGDLNHATVAPFNIEQGDAATG